jgi:adenosylcobinamide kinase / adenosylcobinamide-phosphate guanylyltransferase
MCLNVNCLILVTGGARSGKSEWAETLARKMDLPVIYLATAKIDPQDQKWQDRIEIHRQRRPSHWITLEVGDNLPLAIAQATPNHCLLVDSLGTWVANCLAKNDELWQKIQGELIHCLKLSSNPIILVGEETGWGVIPAYESGRLFRDRLGNLIRLIGGMCDQVYLITGGYALNLKILGISIDDH